MLKKVLLGVVFLIIYIIVAFLIGHYLLVKETSFMQAIVNGLLAGILAFIYCIVLRKI